MTARMKRKFRNLSIAKKMMLIYVCFGGFFFFIAMSGLQISFHIYSQKLYEKSIQELDFFEQKVNDGLREIENLSYRIAMDTTVQENLSEMLLLKYPSFDYNKKLYKMRNIIMNEQDTASSVQTIAYIDPNGIKLEAGISTWRIPQDSEEQLIQQIKEANGAYVTYGPTEECQYLLAGRKIRNRLDMSLNDMGNLLLVCDVSQIIKSNKNRLEAQQAYIAVYSENDMIYCEEEAPAVQLPEYREVSGYRIVTRNGQKYFMCYMKSKETGWMYVNYFLYSDIYGQVQRMQYIMFFCFTCAFLLLIFSMKKVSVLITEPLGHLTESMQVVEKGHFEEAKEIELDIYREDEIGLLSKEFKVMVEELDHLIKENYEKQILLKDTKYKMLRAQINPHFLYNTLNVLNWMIKAGRNEEAGKMIIELGAILHYSFAKLPYATVKEELDMVRSYIAIQKIRYQGRIDFAVTEEGATEQYMIPRMIIQPLVENAINYGAEPYLDVCKITVSVKESADSVILEVADTGAGMTEQELRQIRNMDFKPKGHGIGLKNIKERILMDDENSSFTIDSEIGKGTVVTVQVHKKTGENSYV